MKKKKEDQPKDLRIVFWVGIAVFLGILVYDLSKLTYYYAIDAVMFAALWLVIYSLKKQMRMTNFLMGAILVGLIPHLMGAFGFYSNSPIGIPWDYFTHLVPLIVLAMVFFHTLQPNMDKRFTAKTFMMVVLAFLAALGIGSLIENVEFAGFQALGVGSGGLGFGDGDLIPGQTLSGFNTYLEVNVGGYYNTMFDLLINLLGAFVGIVIMSFRKFVFKVKD